MDIVHIAVVLGLVLAKALSILAILYVPMIIGAKWLPKIDDKGLYLQPSVWMLALLSGAIWGLCLVNYNLDPDYFTVNNIFRTDGPWALTYSQFILDRVNPFNYSFELLLRQLSWKGDGADLSLLLILSGLSFVLLMVKAFTAWGGIGGVRGILYGAAVAIWACYFVIFALCLAVWLLNQLNFWSLALVTLAIHLHRSHNWPIHISTLTAPIAAAMGLHGHGHGHGGHGHGGHGGHHGGGHGDHGGHGHDDGHGHGGGNGHGHNRHGHHPDDDREVDLPEGLTHSLT